LVKTEETKANAGAGGVIIMDEALPGDKNPFLLQPDGASIQGILDSIEHDVEAIDRMTHLTAVRAKKSGPASGVSLSVERQLLNSKLSDLADTVEEVEKRLWKMFLDWQYIETPSEFRIEYSRQYDMRDNQQELNLLIRSMDVISTPEYAEYVESEVAKMMIEDDDKLADILKSIEAVDRTQPIDSQPEDSNPFGNI
jgi:DNA-binding FrmR family transcriptional regulator